MNNRLSTSLCVELLNRCNEKINSLEYEIITNAVIPIYQYIIGIEKTENHLIQNSHSFAYSVLHAFFSPIQHIDRVIPTESNSTLIKVVNYANNCFLLANNFSHTKILLHILN